MNVKWIFHLGILAMLLTTCTRQIAPPTAATEIPSSAQTPSPTSLTNLELDACVAIEEGVRIRQGPGTDYEPIGALAPGACITILGRNTDSTWVYMETASSFTGWVAAWLLIVDGDLSQVSVQNDSDDSNTATENAPFQSVQPCTNVANLLNSSVTCRIETAYCVYSPERDGSPTLCTDKPYPGHVFQFVVFDDDWSEYDGSCMIVTGLLETHSDGQKGFLQMIGRDRSQVTSCE